MKKLLAATIASLVLGLPLAASAAEGWVVADISLQAGPDTEYPSITELPAGSPVSIQGCIDGWTWCDVVAGNDRGWVPGTFLEEEYQNRRVVVVDYGPQIRIPVVSFSINSYWDQHYRSRPFYAQRQEFSARAIHPHAPPRPSGVAASTRQGGSQTQVRDARAPATSTNSATGQNTASASTQNTRTTTATPSTNATSAETAGTTAAKDRQTREHATTQTAPRQSQPATQPDERKQAAQAQAAPEQAPPPVPESKQVRTAQQHATDQPKQRQGEPKAKDELKKPPTKQQNKDEKDKDGDNGGG